MDKEPNNKKRFSLQGVRDALQGLGLSSLMLIVATAIALVAFGSLAWISENRNTGAAGTHMNMDDALFELAVPNNGTTKNNQVTDPLWKEGERGVYNIISDTWIHTLLPAEMGFSTAETDIKTGNGKSGLVCAMVITSGDESLRPGASGYIEFQISPKKDDLTFTGFLKLAAMGRRTEGGRIVYDRLDEAKYGELTAYQISQDVRWNAYNYLEGHVLFFSAEPIYQTAAANSAYWIEPDTGFAVTGAASAIRSYTVLIYWEWPRTEERLKELLTAEQIEENSERYYGPTEDPAPDYNMLYNNADTEIGKHLSHISAELSLEVNDTTAGLPTITAVSP